MTDERCCDLPLQSLAHDAFGSWHSGDVTSPATDAPPSIDPEALAELAALSARRDRLARVLTALMMLGYFGFISLVAFDKQTAGTLIAGGGLSLGILLGAAVILLAPLLTSIYVRWANRHYDVAVRRLRGGTR